MWAEIGLVLFLLLFAGVLAYTFAARNRATFERARTLPLDGDPQLATDTREARNE
jgi:cbb3-type cytochrome oxidase subunit 3